MGIGFNMKRYAIGDIHGNCKGLIECLKAVDFSYADDKLIVLGDVVDGYPETKKCVNVLLTIKNLVMVLGNHDAWALEWMKTGYAERIWTSQGGQATINSYIEDGEEVPERHIRFFEKALPYYEEDDCLFVHGGIKMNTRAEENRPYDMTWDRTLAETSFHKSIDTKKLTPYKEVFIGHTTTYCFNTDKPVHGYEVWNLDTGAGWGGRLTIMNLDTHEYWQSELAKKLYPNHHGRR